LSAFTEGALRGIHQLLNGGTQSGLGVDDGGVALHHGHADDDEGTRHVDGASCEQKPDEEIELCEDCFLIEEVTGVGVFDS
jgi:hypothetical protein